MLNTDAEIFFIDIYSFNYFRIEENANNTMTPSLNVIDATRTILRLCIKWAVKINCRFHCNVYNHNVSTIELNRAAAIRYNLWQCADIYRNTRKPSLKLCNAALKCLREKLHLGRGRCNMQRAIGIKCIYRVHR